MVLLKNFKKLKGNSILETVISITIISTCFLIATLVYSSILKQNKSIYYYEAKHKVKELFNEIKNTDAYEKQTYIFENYTIKKDVIISKELNTTTIKWVIHVNNKNYKFKNLIPNNLEE